MLHSRYNSKQDLEAYSAHPTHVTVAKGNIFPIIEDIMVVDWIVDDLSAHLVPPQGSAIRVSFLKLNDDAARDRVLGGFSIASLVVFLGSSELEAVDSNEELLNYQKDKVRDYIESVVVVDYVVLPSPAQSANL
ncbi:hypothetical protein RJT34_33042 [Clitoria ternatea]|uniref:Stress-response A/B barrel domain-containing protein n=1 Tax=Clitoria ternatea TaxID=43366 RepID=A0AAN9EXK3_CLITE